VHKLSIVGIGPGSRHLRTAAATRTISSADYVVGYRPYLELIGDLLPGKQVFSSGMGKEVDRVKMALDLSERGSVALVSSGDPNIYGMAGLGLEMAPEPSKVEVIPAVTSFTAASCRAGLFFRQCVATISLSDLLTPWPQIENRLRAAAETEMPVALYNPKSKKRDWQMLKALEICGSREILVAKEIGRAGEEIFFTSSERLIEDPVLREKINMTTLVIILGRGTFRGKASQKSALGLVGIGPGNPENLTSEAESILKASDKVFGAERYLLEIDGVTSAEKISNIGPWSDRMDDRCKEASKAIEAGKRATILTGGDPSIFSSGWRIIEQSILPVHISPGVSAFSSVAAKAGAPLVNDFALLSSAHDPAGLSALAKAGFAVVVYNVKGQEIASLLEGVDPGRPVVLAQDVARNDEKFTMLTAEDLMAAGPSGFRFTLLVASANSHIKDGRIITKRGYENKYNYKS
jgi:precorrin-3B C17-methyltransferase